MILALERQGGLFIETNIKNEHQEAFAKLNKLSSYILEDIEESSTAVSKFNNRAWQFQIPLIICSAIVTIFLGLDANNWTWGVVFFKNSAVFFSALVTALHTWNTFSNYSKRADQERIFVNNSSVIYRDVKLYIEGNTECKLEDYNSLKDRYSRIHDEYTEERSSKTSEEPNNSKEE